ncbi:uncharacterized protein LOC115402129 isoform X2 [Salarias fasciatus]|uniref:uncharacterized protein LOC115402129 isoform X2 n=1 Tax=Salarias fasciatus TaxID=181472 RepID=UPI001176F642|nr:uncharacterized protein LOC115402129 isoform X2 [Salarias fasciatus]
METEPQEKAKLHPALKAFWEMSFQCWPGSVPEGGPQGSRRWLRHFLLLKLATVLLCPPVADLPLLVGCAFSLRALLLLRSPHISTKPSTVLLGQLALADGLVPLRWALRLAVDLGGWVARAEGEPPGRWREAVSALCLQLPDAHHLASLLLLGLLGLEATLVSRWPQQTRRLRTSQWAQLGCALVWMLVLLELVCLLQAELLQDSRPQAGVSVLQNSPQTGSLGPVTPQALPAFSLTLRGTLWTVNSWMHYTVFNSKPQRRRSSFH